jgi:hypothetical protein
MLKITLLLRQTQQGWIMIIASLFFNHSTAQGMKGYLPDEWVTNYNGQDFTLRNAGHAEKHCLMDLENCAMRACYDTAARFITSFSDAHIMEDLIKNAWQQIVRGVIIPDKNILPLERFLEANLAEADTTGMIFYGRAVFDQITLIIRRTTVNVVYELVTAFPSNLVRRNRRDFWGTRAVP